MSRRAVAVLVVRAFGIVSLVHSVGLWRVAGEFWLMAARFNSSPQDLGDIMIPPMDAMPYAGPPMAGAVLLTLVGLYAVLFGGVLIRKFERDFTRGQPEEETA